MPWKYHNIRREEHEDGLHYKAELFVHAADRLTYAPVVGLQAGWTTDVATVIDFAAKPMGPHWGYEIAARQNPNVTTHRDHRGTFYECSFYVLAANMSSLPKHGDSISWAPYGPMYTISTSTSYTLTPGGIGNEIIFLAGSTLTLFTPVVATTATTYIYNQSSGSISIIGTVSGVTSISAGEKVSLTYDGSTWIATVVSSIPGSPAYVFDIKSKMLGNGSYYVTISACEKQFQLGLTAR